MPEQTKTTEIIPPPVIGIDVAKLGGDRTAEVKFRRGPNGMLEMVECWTYGETIEGEPGSVKDA